MSYQEPLEQYAVAISVSESADMSALGLSDGHLRDAMAEVARHLLALGARLVYGGDLRQHGFSELLFELVARHGRDADAGGERDDITNYLAWPVHMLQSAADIKAAVEALEGTAKLVCLQIDGSRMSLAERYALPSRQSTESEWASGLTAMRQTMLADTAARVVLGGRTEKYKGAMPGIAEEALLALQAGQPLYLLGGFGGCTRDIAETIGLVQPWTQKPRGWQSRSVFNNFSNVNLNNGLTAEENTTLARTPHVDQAIMLVLRGLINLKTGRFGLQATQE